MTRHRSSAGLCTLLMGCLLLAAAGCGSSAESTEARPAVAASPVETENADPAPRESEASDARRKAAEAGKYLFAFFWKADDANTAAMRKVFDETMDKIVDRADAVTVDIGDPAEKAIVQEYGVDRAPMPLVLAIAPNGAVTGGFPTKFEERELLDAFASPGAQHCIKSLQDGKLVVLCVQNEKTKSNEESMEGVRQFQTDPRFGRATEVVTIDPDDENEAAFLSDLRIDVETEIALALLLAPPGSPLGVLEGATTKDDFLMLLMRGGSGGCCPQPH